MLLLLLRHRRPRARPRPRATPCRHRLAMKAGRAKQRRARSAQFLQICTRIFSIYGTKDFGKMDRQTVARRSAQLPPNSASKTQRRRTVRRVSREPSIYPEPTSEPNILRSRKRLEVKNAALGHLLQLVRLRAIGERKRLSRQIQRTARVRSMML